MTPRLSSHGLFVDHVLGWMAQVGDAESAVVCSPGTDRQTRPSHPHELEEQAAKGVKTEDSRPRDRRFPYFR
jgi:hypothetical protein